MNKFLLFVTVTAVFNSFAQAPEVQWSKVLGGSGFEQGYQVIETEDNGFLICSSTNSSDGDIVQALGQKDIFLVKTNANGVVQWKKVFGGSADDDGIVKQTNDGGFIIAGTTSSNDGDVAENNGSADFWLVKLDAAGNIIWENTFGGSSGEVFSQLVINTNGSYTMFGTTGSNDGDVTGYHSMEDLWVINVSEEGVLQWQKAIGGGQQDQPRDIKATTDGGVILYSLTYSYDGDVDTSSSGALSWAIKLDAAGVMQWQSIISGGGQQFPTSIEQTADGGYIAITTTNVGVPLDLIVKKLNSSGEAEWQRSFGGSSIEEGIVKQTNDGGYIISAYTQSTNGDAAGSNGMFDLLIIKLNALGENQWINTYGGNNWEHFVNAPGYFYYHFTDANIYQTQDGGFVITASSQSYNNGDVTGGYNGSIGTNDIWILKIDADGNVEWDKSVGGSSDEYSHSIIQTNDNGYILVGTTFSTNGEATGNHGSGDAIVVKLGSEALSSGNYTAQQLSVYPNPATSQLNIVLPNNTVAETVSVIDVTGKKVLQQSGTSILNVENLQSGIYFIEVASQEVLYRSKFIKK